MPARTFGEKVLAFNKSLRAGFRLPHGVEVLNPFSEKPAREACRAFYHAFYGDRRPRVFLFGINPGRRGAGVTGIPFTDPVHLAENCGIANDFPKVPELSSTFVYRLIEKYGGAGSFYGRFYITAVFPLGFVRDGRNLNYYDDPALLKACGPDMVKFIERQLSFGAAGDTCFSLGAGRNLQILSKLNDAHGWFRRVEPLPHPRWVMQYRRRHVDRYVDLYLGALRAAG
jgi:hypothetical protein